MTDMLSILHLQSLCNVAVCCTEQAKGKDKINTDTVYSFSSSSVHVTLLCILRLLCCMMFHCVANVALNMLKERNQHRHGRLVLIILCPCHML